MPYKSKAQMRMMHAKHPKIAARWDEEMSVHPQDIKKLPAKVKPKSPPRAKPKAKPKPKGTV